MFRGSSINPEFIVKTVSDTVKLVRMNEEIITTNFTFVTDADAVINDLCAMVPYGALVELSKLTGNFYSTVNKACAKASKESKRQLKSARWKLENFRTKVAQTPEYAKRLLFEYCDAYLNASDEHYEFIFDIQMKTIAIIEAMTSDTSKILGQSGIEDMADMKKDAVQKNVDELKTMLDRLKHMERQRPEVAAPETTATT
jgi:hypothetical protein